MRVESCQKRVQRAALVGGCDRAQPVLAAPVELIVEHHAADRLGGGLGLVAVVEIDRREYVAQRAGGQASGEHVRPESLERGCADSEGFRQAVCRVGAIVPEIGLGMGAVIAAGMPVGDVEQAVGAGLGEDAVQRGRFGIALAELAIEPGDRHLVPFADAGVVSARGVDLAGIVQRHERGGVVHHRGPVRDRGREIVGKADRVPDLVRGELADTGQGQFQRIVRRAGAGAVGAKQAFEDHPVLPHALAAQDDMSLDDLAGARIDNRCTIGPAAGLAVHPLDDVVADIERVGVFGQKLDPEGVFIAGRLEGLGPPGRAFDQGVADQGRCAAVEIVDDGLDHGAAFGRRVDALQPVPDRVGAADRLVERCSHVVEIERDRA